MFGSEFWTWVSGLLINAVLIIANEAFLYLLVGIVLGVPLYFIGRWIRGKDNPKPKPQKEDMWFQSKPNVLGEFRLPKGAVWVGIVIVAIFVGIMIRETTIPNETVTLLERLVLWAPFAAMGILMILYSANKRITLREDHFACRNTWGRTHKIPYESITQYGIREFVKKGKRVEDSYSIYDIYVGEKKYKLTIFSLVEFEHLREILLEKAGPDKEKNSANWDQK